MNKTYPSTEVWIKMNEQLQKSILNQSINQQDLTSLNFSFENLALLQHQLNHTINIWKSSSISQNDQILLKQQIPLLLYALNQNLSTINTMLILDLFILMAFKNYDYIVKTLVQNFGVPFLLNRIQDENLEICQKSFQLLATIPKKYLNDIGALSILINVSERIKIDSRDYFDLIIEIAKYAKRKDHLQLVCKYILQTYPCEPIYYLQKIVHLLNKSSAQQDLSMILLEGQILSILIKIYNRGSSNTEQKCYYCLYLIYLLKQHSQQQKEFSSNDILLFFNMNIDRHNYMLTDLYSKSLYQVTFHNCDLIKQVIKNQQIINNLFTFYDQKAVANFNQIFNRIIEFDLDFEIKYLIKKGILFKYYSQLNRNDQGLHSTLKGLYQLLIKGYIQENLNQLQKQVRNSTVNNMEDKNLQQEIVRLIQQKKQ
ncbi:unnamed protein product [Paramecium pentaurelia]|uniref:Uncharacterized protein n=1 Tax=Paramecium pentaurelia TaxID=43138 RepID=A0A8S1S1D6_9CILI|nr:unnamed protein product [Paramecium pentaurelia]